MYTAYVENCMSKRGGERDKWKEGVLTGSYVMEIELDEEPRVYEQRDTKICVNVVVETEIGERG